jgi:glutamate-1-semialdehyde 2,1-aminomutase
MKMTRSSVEFRRAKKSIPGGVNSPVRAFRAVGGKPVFAARGKGSRLTDIDGNEYVDYVMSWGPLMMGHAAKPVLSAISKAMASGTTFGAPTAAEVDLAEEIRSAFPSMDLVRLVSSGTEACMSALRAARGFTGRDIIAKFDGCYHGHVDSLLVKAGSGLATFGAPDSAGVPKDIAKNTMVLPYNDLKAVERGLKSKKVAALIVEPVAGNMGVVLPENGFLAGLRRACTKTGTLLIFDEVMTGLRPCYGGVQTVYDIEPDLTTLGKIVGGGMPLAAYGGRREIMERISPVGPVYQAGTLSGNPLAVAAGLAQIRWLKEHEEEYAAIEVRAQALEAGLGEVAKRRRRDVCINRFGSMLTVFFQKGPVRDWATASKSDTKAFGVFHRRMLACGVYLPPSQYEAWFLSMAHSDADIERTLEAAVRSL